MPVISKEKLEKLQRKYKTDEAIGDKYNITRQAVHQLRAKYGIPALTNKNADRDDNIIQDHKDGISGTELAKKYELSMAQIYRVLSSVSKTTKKPTGKKPSKKPPVRKVVKKSPVKKAIAKKPPIKKAIVKKTVIKKPIRKIVRRKIKKA